jgi:Flp pilus assembly protein TadG
MRDMRDARVHEDMGSPATQRPARPRLVGDDGAAAVEFALVLMLLVMLIFGIFEFGRAYNANVTLTHATREGVRELAISGDQAAAANVTLNAATSLDPALMQVTTSGCTPGQMTWVRAEYPFSLSIPGFGTATFDLHSEAVMRCGG